MSEARNENECFEADVGPEAAGRRLDQFLASALPDLSRSRIKALILDGGVSRSGATIEDPSQRVKQGDRYRVTLPALAPAAPQPEDIELAVMFEDEDLIVVDKPAGMVVHPAAGHGRGTLVNALLHHCRGSLSGIGGIERPGIVHRLDKDTSGLLVAAKSDRAHRALAAQFAAHTIDRAYQALVWGAPRPLTGAIDAALTRPTAARPKVGVVAPDSAKGRHAVTHYETRTRFGDPLDPLISLIACRLETGRTHQIRVHLAHIGCPLLGDPVYGGGRKLIADEFAGPAYAALKTAISGFSRQALHAARLGFVHPSTGTSLLFESSLPKDLRYLISLLEEL